MHIRVVYEYKNVDKSSESTVDKLKKEEIIRKEVAAKEEIAATTLADEQASMSEQEQMPLKEEPDIRSSEGPKVIGGKVRGVSESIQRASFSEFEQTDIGEKGQRNLNMLLDIPLQVTVELGKTKKIGRAHV